MFDEPVHPEPAFAPFLGHWPLSESIIDDGRRPTRLSSLVRSLGERFVKAPMPPAADVPDEEPNPIGLSRKPGVEFPVFLPATLDPRREVFGQFLASLSLCAEPIAFEVFGTPSRIVAQLASSPDDAGLVHQQLRAFFPEVSCVPSDNGLRLAWREDLEAESVVVEFGLAEHFMRLLSVGKADALVALAGALEGLGEDEFGMYQVIFAPVQNPWAENIVRSTTDPTGKPFFVNAHDLADEAKRKVERPLYAAVVRIAARSPEYLRVSEISCHLAGALCDFGRPGGNELIPLINDDYPIEAHVEDVLSRQSRRSGMIVNRDELLGFVHLPSSEVRSAKLVRQTKKSKPAPDAVCNEGGWQLGENVHLGQTRMVALTPEQRVRHTHIVGVSGTGKSTLLFNLIRQDAENGQGFAVLDPHGDLIEQVLGIIPEERIDDIVFLDPADESYSVGFNILSAQSDLEKTLLSSDLVSVFKRLSTSWGDQMGSVLSNAILAFLESSEGGTLSDLRRFLLEPAYRDRFLATVRDQNVVYYWKKVFSQLSGNKSIGPVVTRLDSFLAPKPIRYMVSQKKNRLDFPAILDGGKIFLAKLSQGAIGHENAYLLGSLLMAKFQQTAMSRQRQAQALRRDFWLYLDEFHNFITPSLAEILSGARKYRLGLVLAHQELRHLQRDPEVASAVLSNTGTRVCFRLGDQDARAMESGFSSFEARDIQNLDTGEAICRVERSDFDFNLSVPMPKFPSEAEASAVRQRIVAASREKYGMSRAEVETLLSATHGVEEPSRAPAKTEIAPPVSAPATPVPQPPAPEPVPTATVKPVADLGRGGAQHQAIQHRIKEAAEATGFRVHVEKSVLDDAGCVDLVIERDGLSVAVEVTVTNTIDYEIGNVAKCAKAGFQEIAVIAASEDKLSKLEAAVKNSLGPEIGAKTKFYLPDAFIAFLKSMPPSPSRKPESTERTTRGYRVKRNYVPVSPEEARAREGAVIKLIADSMRRKTASGA